MAGTDGRRPFGLRRPWPGHQPLILGCGCACGAPGCCGGAAPGCCGGVAPGCCGGGVPGSAGCGSCCCGVGPANRDPHNGPWSSLHPTLPYLHPLRGPHLTYIQPRGRKTGTPPSLNSTPYSYNTQATYMSTCGQNFPQVPMSPPLAPRLPT